MVFKLYQRRTLLLDSSFGFLNLANELVVLLPNFLNNSILLLHENIVDFVRLIFEASSSCKFKRSYINTYINAIEFRLQRIF